MSDSQENQDEVFNAVPNPRLPTGNYENLSFYYSYPTMTYCQFPSGTATYQAPSQTNVFYFSAPRPNGNYFPVADAYPSFPYTPCLFPNTSFD